jgi:hypothetical protein
VLSSSVKVPKHENFELAFFTLSDRIWVDDLGTEAKVVFFYYYYFGPDFDGFFSRMLSIR